jgi:hypothetical protein
MNIKIIEQPNDRTDAHGMTCYQCPQHIQNTFIHKSCTLTGIIIIDGVKLEWFYSPLGNDGCIFPEDSEYVRLVKYLIPLYVYNTYGK